MKYISIFVFLLSCGTISAQTNADVFPKSFIRDWRGNSQFFGKKGLKRTDSAGIKIIPIPGKANEYTWQFFIYEEGHRNDEVFILKAAGDQPNHWMLDAQDGMIFDCYLFGNTFHCVLEAKGEIHCMNFKLRDGRIFADITTTDADVLHQTGKGTDMVPFAKTRKVKKFETGIFEKQP